MRYFPLNVELKNRHVVIVGGGSVAWRKCRQLLEAAPCITVISPEISPPFQSVVDTGTIRHLVRRYVFGDLSGAFLAIAATDDPRVNLQVSEEAATSGILISVADDPDQGNFTMPAILTRGELVVTVSTGGKVPGFSRSLRDRLAKEFGSEYALTVSLLGEIREKLLTRGGSTEYNNKILNDFMAIDLPALFRNRDCSEIHRLLVEYFGPEFALHMLDYDNRTFYE